MKPAQKQRGSSMDRAFWLLIFVCALCVCVLSFMLTPAPLGHGTHQQLGLPPCGVMQLTGMPCPGCGLTTSFAHMSRGDLLAAFSANPAGVLLFVATFLTVPLSFGLWWRAVPVTNLVFSRFFVMFLLLVSVTMIVQWIPRLGWSEL